MFSQAFTGPAQFSGAATCLYITYSCPALSLGEDGTLSVSQGMGLFLTSSFGEFYSLQIALP